MSSADEEIPPYLDESGSSLPPSQKVHSNSRITKEEDAQMDREQSPVLNGYEHTIRIGPKRTHGGSPAGHRQDSDQDKPLASQPSINGVKRPIDSDSEEEIPLSKRSLKRRKKVDQRMKITDIPSKPQPSSKEKKPPAKRLKVEVQQEDAQSLSDRSDEDVPLSKKHNKRKKIESNNDHFEDSSASQGKKESLSVKKKFITKNTESRDKPVAKIKKAVAAVKKEDSDSDDDKPLTKRFPTKSRKKEDDKSPVKKRVKTKSNNQGSETPVKEEKKTKTEGGDEDVTNKEEEEEYKWWEADQGDGTQKWTTLEHNGVLFPPPYEPLPKDIKMKYDSQPVTLEPEAEEVAGFFGAMLASQHVENPKFVANFFDDFLDILKKHKPSIPIKKFEKCDFRPMFDYFEIKREEKKQASKEEKKAIKEEKEKLEEQYKFCMLDSRKEQVGNFRIEPPGLFRGRGDHPKTGRLKTRVMPEQISINIGQDATVPEPPPGHSWGEVRHDNTVTWLATWNENINNNTKYVFLAAGSSLKGQSDMKKFEKARMLKDHIDQIRKDYTNELKDEVMQTRQRATAMYLIDRFALRAGNEKGEDEADTVGCCSLKFQHVTLKPPNIVIFDFLGKDSIRYYNEVSVDPQVFKNLKIFKKPPKTENDLLFDRLNTTMLNKHLQNYMSGLTAKVFRTYNASWTFQNELVNTPADASVAEKILAYNRANRQVAILCNHQRSVSKAHGAQMEKLQEKVRGMKYQRVRLQRMIMSLDSKLLKKQPELDEYPSDIEDSWIAKHQSSLIEKEREKIQKKIEKENENETGKAGGGHHFLSESEISERFQILEEMKQEFEEENKTRRVEPKKAATVEKLEQQIVKLDQRIEAAKLQAQDREEGKETALGTSKLNYLDPRLTIAWCRKYQVPIEKLFAKTLRDKFKWALVADEDWKF
ncbi:DNA topoisomerase 1 [Neolecta irregularis DAH-3]|uniref:DNA topoisomerase I n=1 Tax=Neolecta irregularis (strain DAH-3) TaxID=1198029 RepID=A0A1U7LQ83_NEOID|nr:DNA topoisomerase 1 [Neolecta irregularis DAH-3]|eukprot:OLL24804.1 DNA topoisomerase 1 [Neolecta irregularis DAH-3]